MIYRGKIKLEEIRGLIDREEEKVDTREDYASSAYIFPYTTKKLRKDEERALASMVTSMVDRLGR